MNENEWNERIDQHDEQQKAINDTTKCVKWMLLSSNNFEGGRRDEKNGGGGGSGGRLKRRRTNCI